jgi:hypothetical protein
MPAGRHFLLANADDVSLNIHYNIVIPKPSSSFLVFVHGLLMLPASHEFFQNRLLCLACKEWQVVGEN